MELSVKGKQIDVGDALRTHVETNLKDIVGKYFTGSMEASVTFSREAHLFRADITVHAGRNLTLQSYASAAEPYPAFDTAAERMAARLKRHRNRLKDHRADQPAPESVMAPSFVLHGQDDMEPAHDDNPVIVAEMTTAIETLSVSDAVMRLDLSDAPALMFRNSKHGGLNMIYRRPDGHIGWVDPTQTIAAKTGA